MNVFQRANDSPPLRLNEAGVKRAISHLWTELEAQKVSYFSAVLKY